MNRPLATIAAATLAAASMLPPPWAAAQTAGMSGDTGSTATGAPGRVAQPMTAGPGASARTDTRAGSLSLHHIDRRFAARAAADGLAEVELGRLAQEKGASDAVRRFGQRMVDDHTRTNERLMALAKARGIAAPDSLDPAQRATRARLDKLSGDAFDRAYLRGQIDSHDKAIRNFESEVSGGRDAEIKQFATDTLPILREHLQAARNAARQSRPDSNGRSPGG